MLPVKHILNIALLLGSLSALPQVQVDHNLLHFRDSIAYLKKKKQPFTGAVYQLQPKGDTLLTGEYRKGQRHGHWHYFDRDSTDREKLYMAGYPKIDWDELEDRDSIQYWKKTSEPFTGVVKLFYYIIVGGWGNEVKTTNLNFESWYVGGLPHGPFIGWHKNGLKLAEGTHDRGHKTDKITYWRMDETVQYTAELKNDTNNGRYIGWHANGRQSDQQFWNMGIKTGLWKQWHESGQLKREYEYQSGHLNGHWHEWNEEGTLIMDYKYKEDWEHDTLLDYYDDAQLKSKRYYDVGDRINFWEEWHPNRQKKMEGLFLYNRRDGSWKWWDNKGNLISHEAWSDGELKEVKEGSVLNRQVPYDTLIMLNGQMFVKGEGPPYSGRCTMGNTNGQPQEIRTYKFGLEDGPYTSYYPDGKVSREGYYDQAKPYGRSTFYYENGQKKLERYSFHRKLDGPWNEWYENGNPMVQRHFNKGEKHGVWIRWTVEGIKTEEGTYMDGEKHGSWSSWNQKGKLVRTEVYEHGELLEKKNH